MRARLTIPKLRWIIACLLLAVTMINYTDRLTLSVLIGDVRKDLDLSETDYSHLVSLFLAAYAIMYAVSGWVVDRVGTRVGFVIFVGGWSLAQMLHGLAWNKWSLGTFRFLLGLMEPGSFPAAVKAVREWFPTEQRAIGVGIFNTGSALGAAVAAPLAATLGLRYGWRTAFVVTGALGIVWLLCWLILYQPPQRNRWLSQSEAATLGPLMQQTPAGVTGAAVDWKRVFLSRPCLALMLARFLADPVIYFVIFWLPAYLQKERGFSLTMIGRYAWIPYVVGGFGYVIGGWFSGRLLRAGWSLCRARKFALAAGAVLLPTAILAPLVPTATLAIAATSVVVFGHAIWVSNLLTLPADLFPASEVGTASGFTGMAGSVGGILANLGTGYIVSTFSYSPIFVAAGLLHPVSCLLLWWLLSPRLFDQK